MPLGTEVDLGPGDVVLDMNPSPPKTGGQQPLPHFSAHILWSNGCYMDVCCVWYGMEVGLGTGDIVLDGNPTSPTPIKGVNNPQFSAHVYCGQTVAHPATADHFLMKWHENPPIILYRFC